MSNAKIADIFNEIADFLELQDDNPFRIRAYRKAALNVQGLSEDLVEIAGRGELTQIPGIGSDLEQKIEEYLKTGKIEYHEKLKRKIPSVLLEMTEIPGIGPKTASLLHKRLKVKSIDDLEEKAKTHRIQRLPGIKEKTEENILRGISLFRRHRERTSLGKALPLARDILARLKSFPGIQEISYAGSVRRMRETVRDIDILITSKRSETIMNFFVSLPIVDKVLVHGETKSSVITREGIQVDLRVVPPESFGASLLYFTGSKAHNIQLRALAKKRGYKINEYGIYDEKTGKKLAGRDEEECYRFLKFDFIPPELREDRGEIKAAARHELPQLVDREDLRGDFHMHSNWSDGVNEIDDVVRCAQANGLEYMVLTDHSKSLKIAGGLLEKDLLRQIRLIGKLNKRLKGIKVLAGSEVDILKDGSLDFRDDILARLDFVVASIHSGFKQSKKQLTDRIVKAMKNKYVNLIAHPTGRLMGERDSYEVDHEEIFRVARDTNTALEINAYPGRLDLSDIHVARARELGVSLAVCSDAHSLDQFDNLEYGVSVARRGWCEKRHLLNCLSLVQLKEKIAKG